MIKKQYIQPTLKAIKLESSEMICGSGDATETVSFGDPNDDDDAPESTSQGGYTGIFGE